MMRLIRVFVVLATATLMTAGCSNSVERVEKEPYNCEAQEKIAKERLELVEKYQKCIKKAGEDEQKIGACDSYLKAAEALK